ncbi:MAG: GNAT family N-acetyltransferase [Planctomycetota bacterium]|jgi:GNAT superfamily N-acetyltransferase
MGEEVQPSPKDKGTGSLTRLVKAFKRRLPKTYTLLVSAGPPDLKFEGLLERKGFRTIDITTENIDEALSFRKPDVVTQMRQYLQRGCTGWFVALGDTIVGYAFMAAVRDKPTVVRRLILHPGEAGVILVYTRPEYRIFGLGAAMGMEMSAKAAALGGMHNLVVWTAPTHSHWLRSLQEIDPRMKPAGKVWILELFGRPVFRHTTGSPVKR